jgi:flagellar basal-body rod modification protein FlgD
VPISLLQMLNSATHPVSRASSPRPSAASSSSSSSASSSSSTVTPGVDLTSTFLQLLTTQLKNQSPLNPLDPNQFVVQLAQFDSLGELTQIQELMQTLVNDVKAPPTPTPAATAGVGATSAAQLNSVTH